MKRYYCLSLLLMSVFFSGCNKKQNILLDRNNSCAENNTKVILPNDLIFNDEPIDSYVIYKIVTEYSPLPISKNIKEILKEKIEKIKEVSPKKIFGKLPEDMFGYYFDDKELKKITFNCRSSIFWKYLGSINKSSKHIIFSECFDGGSGIFTDIFVVERNGDNLVKLKSLIGGDRANGGVMDIAFENGVLCGTLNVTPYDFLKKSISFLDKENKRDCIKYKGINISFVPYDDISCAAQSYCGKLHFQLFLDNDAKIVDYKTDKIVLNENFIENKISKKLIQKCFDQVYKEYLNKDCKVLDHLGMQQFAKDVLERFVLLK